MVSPYTTAAMLRDKYLQLPAAKALADKWLDEVVERSKTGSPRRTVKGAPHRRFFWRVRHRIGPNWDKLSEKEINCLMRQRSWRRAL